MHYIFFMQEKPNPTVQAVQNAQNNSGKKISESAKKRMILLLNLLEKWENPRITSKEIANLLGVKDSLVRCDFGFLRLPSEHRGFKNGYDVCVLAEDIRISLGFFKDSDVFCCDERHISPNENVSGNYEKKLCIVGLGRLGAALLDNRFFEKSGFKIYAGFDSSLNRVELIRSTFELFPASRIESVCSAKKIEYAILCCEEDEVQKMADRLVKAGIKGIVNYTNAVFAAPKNVKVQNVSPSVALALVE